MASSEQSHSELLGRPLTARRVESVPPTAPVRHVDQLEEDALETILELVSGEQPTTATATDLEAGEILVYTDYYRIERV